MLAAPFAAMSFRSLKDIKKSFQEFSDKVYYGETLPPVGSLSLSYAKFLDLMEARQVKRITLMADGKIALVEVQHTTSHAALLNSTAALMAILLNSFLLTLLTLY